MTWLHLAVINWFDLFNYPHVGKPGPGQFDGPPVVFVLLDFALFLWLCHRFLGRALVRMGQEERRRFQDEVAEAVAREAEADRVSAHVCELRETRAERELEITEKVSQEMGIEREIILDKARAYEAMRRNETLKQVMIKQDMTIRQIRDELLVESLQRVRAALPGHLDPVSAPRLFQQGLDSTFEETVRHER